MLFDINNESMALYTPNLWNYYTAYYSFLFFSLSNYWVKFLHTSVVKYIIRYRVDMTDGRGTVHNPVTIKLIQ